MATRRAVLVVVGGLPGTGKTTVATAHVRATGAAFLRIEAGTLVTDAVRRAAG